MTINNQSPGSHPGELHGVVNADQGVLHAVDQEQAGVAPHELGLVDQRGSLVQPHRERVISAAKIFLGFKLICRK